MTYHYNYMAVNVCIILKYGEAVGLWTTSFFTGETVQKWKHMTMVVGAERKANMWRMLIKPSGNIWQILESF